MISRHCRRSVSAGLRRCYTRGGTRLGRSHGGIQKRARKTPGRVLVLGTTVSPTAHRHPTDNAPFTTPVTSNHQYLPKLFLSSSRDQVREELRENFDHAVSW